MGEAKRLAAAGAKGNADGQGKPREGGVRHMGTVEANKLVVLPDHLALTFTHPKGCSSLVVALSDLDTILAGVERTLGIQPGDRGDLYKHALYRHAVLGAMKLKQDADGLAGVLMTVLWAALEHPKGGRKTRAALSAMVQERGSARLNVEANGTGVWAFAVAAGYTPMGPLLDKVPLGPAPMTVGVSLNDDKARVLQ